MKSYFSLLREVQKRPEMFVGMQETLFETLYQIELLLAGFELREAYETGMKSTDFGHKFREFANESLQISGTRVAGIAFALKQKHASPSAAWHEFFELVAQFEAKYLDANPD